MRICPVMPPLSAAGRSLGQVLPTNRFARRCAGRSPTCKATLEADVPADRSSPPSISISMRCGSHRGNFYPLSDGAGTAIGIAQTNHRRATSKPAAIGVGYQEKVPILLRQGVHRRGKRALIPARLSLDLRPGSGGDGGDGLGQFQEGVPGMSAGFEDCVIVVVDAVAEEVAAQELPDVLHWVKFGRVGRAAAGRCCRGCRGSVRRRVRRRGRQGGGVAEIGRSCGTRCRSATDVCWW